MADVRFPAAESAHWGGRRKKGGTGQLRASSAALSLHKRGNSGNASLRTHPRACSVSAVPTNLGVVTVSPGDGCLLR